MEGVSRIWGDHVVDAFLGDHPELRDEHDGETIKEAFMRWWVSGAQKKHGEGPKNWDAIRPLEYAVKGTDGHVRLDTSHVNWYQMACKDVAKAVGSKEGVALKLGGEDPSLLGPGPLGIHAMHGSELEVVEATSGQVIPVKTEHVTTQMGPLHVASSARDDHLNQWCDKVVKAVGALPEKARNDPVKVAKEIGTITPDNFLTGHSNLRTEKTVTPVSLARLVTANPTTFQDKLHGAVRLGQDIPPRSYKTAPSSPSTATASTSGKEEAGTGHVCKDCAGGMSERDGAGHLCKDCKDDLYRNPEGGHICKDCRHEMAGSGSATKPEWVPLASVVAGLKASDYEEHDHRVGMQLHDQTHLGVDVNDTKNTIYVAAKTERQLEDKTFGAGYESRSHGHSGTFGVRTNNPKTGEKESADIVIKGISSDGKRTPTCTVLFPRKDKEYPEGATVLRGVHLWKHSTLPNVVMYAPM